MTQHLVWDPEPTVFQGHLARQLRELLDASTGGRLFQIAFCCIYRADGRPPGEIVFAYRDDATLHVEGALHSYEEYMPKYQRLGLSARHAFVGLDVHRTSRIFPHRGNEPIKAIQRRVTGAILEAGVLDSLGSPPVGVGHHMVMEILPCGDGCEQGVQSLAARMALYVEVLYGAAAGAMRGDVA